MSYDNINGLLHEKAKAGRNRGTVEQMFGAPLE